ncbi:hypothetical protein Ga0609869_000456 [Rhodovulum iodosum]|uniref:DUF2497 domain-containing protein n=1 Tax=Rhodovulum iodosum TaxID=68291 RepID=A0ABV3XPS7_9RHOB|nr:hypothetical protein [Rhodovulum robiginosum]RSK31589.1 hypothetical protein EJA01_15795 [Rhodovulum robiginosum]
MSDTMKTAELEDVLSSIRRLVTEQAEARGPGASRLVLTPSLRIDASAAPDLSEFDLDEADDLPGDDVCEDDATDDERAFDAGEDPEAASEEAWELAWDEEEGGAPSLEERLSELEAAVAATPDETAWAASSARVGSTRLHIGLPEDPSYDDAAEAEEEPEEYRAASAARTRARWQPQPSQRDLDASDEADDTASEDLFSSLEDALDEDALRALVSEIVREELQGALGERITRNVRKLVRSEINRVLSSRAFD